MKTIIYLHDNVFSVFNQLIETREICINSDRKTVLLAVKTFADKGLRYNTKTGKTYLSGIKMSEYVKNSDIPIYANEQECSFWEFAGFICNGISRVQRGYKII